MDFQIYSLKECGFYNRVTDEYLFGDINNWWDDFVSWTNTNNFFNTKTFCHSKSETPSVYCSHSGSINGIRYLSLWNETTSRKGKVLSMPKEGTVNNIQPYENNLGKDTIPGWESNFIIDPQSNYFISISLNNKQSVRALGFWQMEKYFQNYLRNFSKYRTTEQVNDNTRFLGFNSANESNVERINGKKREFDLRFKCTKVTLPATINEIRNNVDKIRMLVYRTKLDFRTPEQNKKAKGFLKLLGVASTNDFTPQDTSHTLLSEVPWNPILKDFDATYSRWKENHECEDMGVKFERNLSNIVWFDKTMAKDNINLSEELESLQTINRENYANIWKYAQERIKIKYLREQK